MISWIKGELINQWQINNKFFILINCQGLGYEIQILESFFIKLKTKQISEKNIILWLKHIKKEDSDSFFGFISKNQKDFFIEILNIKGIGSQIGMSLLNKFTINEIIDAINKKDKELISSIPGVGQKMTERIIIELKSYLGTNSKSQDDVNNYPIFESDAETDSLIEDLNLTLLSLNYSKREIKNVMPHIKKDVKNVDDLREDKNKISFEKVLKLAMNYLDKNSSNKDQ